MALDLKFSERINMTRCKVIYLSIVSILLLISTVITASADANSANETNPIPPTYDNNTGIVKREITLNMNFLTSMLQMLDLNLYLINETLNAHIEEYPFLKPTLEGTKEGINGVNSILVALGVSPPENLNDTNVTSSSLNETLSQINSSLQYPDGMVEDANSTMGESNITTPMIGDMFKSIKTMTTLINQF
jgi:hypothetical protein